MPNVIFMDSPYKGEGYGAGRTCATPRLCGLLPGGEQVALGAHTGGEAVGSPPRARPGPFPGGLFSRGRAGAASSGTAAPVAYQDLSAEVGQPVVAWRKCPLTCYAYWSLGCLKCEAKFAAPESFVEGLSSRVS